MWIRSQDKTQLVKCEHINIEEKKKLKAYKNDKGDFFPQFKEEGTGKWLVLNFECILGEYSSKKQAMKVLDMIKNYIEENEEIKHVCCDYVCGNYREYKVFQVPQDDEV